MSTSVGFLRSRSPNLDVDLNEISASAESQNNSDPITFIDNRINSDLNSVVNRVVNIEEYNSQPCQSCNKFNLQVGTTICDKCLSILREWDDLMHEKDSIEYENKLNKFMEDSSNRNICPVYEKLNNKLEQHPKILDLSNVYRSTESPCEICNKKTFNISEGRKICDNCLCQIWDNKTVQQGDNYVNCTKCSVRININRGVVMCDECVEYERRNRISSPLLSPEDEVELNNDIISHIGDENGIERPVVPPMMNRGLCDICAIDKQLNIMKCCEGKKICDDCILQIMNTESKKCPYCSCKVYIKLLLSVLVYRDTRRRVVMVPILPVIQPQLVVAPIVVSRVVRLNTTIHEVFNRTIGYLTNMQTYYNILRVRPPPLIVRNRHQPQEENIIHVENGSGPNRMRTVPGGNNVDNYNGHLIDVETEDVQCVKLRNENMWDWLFFRVPNFIEYDQRQYIEPMNKIITVPRAIFHEMAAISLAARLCSDDRQLLNVTTEYVKQQMKKVANMDVQDWTEAIYHMPLLCYNNYLTYSIQQNPEARFQYYIRKWGEYAYRAKYLAVKITKFVLPILKYVVLPLFLYKLRPKNRLLSVYPYVNTASQILTDEFSQINNTMSGLKGMYASTQLVNLETYSFPMEARAAAVIITLGALKNTFYDCAMTSWICPILEEISKRAMNTSNNLVFNFKNTLTFCGFEALLHNFYYGTPLLMYGIYHLPAHILLAQLPIKFAIVGHICLNSYIIFATNVSVGVGMVSPVVLASAGAVALMYIIDLIKKFWRTSNIKSYLLENSEPIEVQLKPSSLMQVPVVNKIPNECKVSQHLYGVGTLYRPVAYQANLHNEEIAVQARVLKQTPVPNMVDVNACINMMKQNYHKLLPITSRTYIEPMKFEEYILNSNASPTVKKILTKTKMKLDKLGINEHSRLSKEQLYKWTTRKSFVKVENLPYRSRGNKKIKAPRLIQGATPEYIVLVGPWIAALQKIMKRDLNGKRNMVFTSGMDAKKLATMLMEHDGQLGEDDIANYDSSFCREFMEAEHWFVSKLGAPKATKDLIKENVDTHGYTFQGIKYKTNGTRNSGDPFTSLFNSFWNLLFHIYIITKVNVISFEECLRLVLMLAAGDDNAMSISRILIMPDFKAEMLNLGFESEFILREWEELEFCSNRLYKTEDGKYMFGPKPGKVMSKIGYYVQPPSLKLVSQKSMVRGTAIGLIPACYHIPILRDYIYHLLRMTNGSRAYFNRDEPWKMNYKKDNGNIYNDFLLANTYNLSHSSYKIFNKCMDKCELGDVADFPIMNMICDRDTSAEKSN